MMPVAAVLLFSGVCFPIPALPALCNNISLNFIHLERNDSGLPAEKKATLVQSALKSEKRRLGWR